ncbi:hypothetical protein KUL42_31860 [Alteromonas sp. KUL42]|uniref:hypothetical protein n=1 Tax=Alteromonas sp. KUL42 TaxID=2480797 RepID=UPI000A693537|nr:hypothetical protein [Alteromonas sp. KUL42]GEA08425.1 hypothetical protein KUL42_31860 [Alteromonas sp. KUL42]
MSTLLKKLTTSNSHRVSPTTGQSIRMQCNYADNYYGDQVCVEVKSPKLRTNRHVGVQL